jgi:hypothetical protein
MTSAISKSAKKGWTVRITSGADVSSGRVHDRIAVRHSQSRELPPLLDRSAQTGSP